MIAKKDELIPLDNLRSGMNARVANIQAGQGLRSRLASLGLLANAPIKVIRNDGAGQLIVEVKQSKVILGRGMSHKIFVIKL